jgi:hypothetical protein
MRELNWKTVGDCLFFATGLTSFMFLMKYIISSVYISYIHAYHNLMELGLVDPNLDIIHKFVLSFSVTIFIFLISLTYFVARKYIIPLLEDEWQRIKISKAKRERCQKK